MTPFHADEAHAAAERMAIDARQVELAAAAAGQLDEGRGIELMR
jgi:hypothetical protein